jgi:hypothetical protein
VSFDRDVRSLPLLEGHKAALQAVLAMWARGLTRPAHGTGTGTSMGGGLTTASATSSAALALSLAGSATAPLPVVVDQSSVRLQSGLGGVLNPNPTVTPAGALGAVAPTGGPAAAQATSLAPLAALGPVTAPAPAHTQIAIQPETGTFTGQSDGSPRARSPVRVRVTGMRSPPGYLTDLLGEVETQPEQPPPPPQAPSQAESSGPEPQVSRVPAGGGFGGRPC